MVRALTPYFAAASLLSAVSGWAYAAATIGVLAVYGALTLSCAIGIVGYVRWDQRQHRQR